MNKDFKYTLNKLEDKSFRSIKFTTEEDVKKFIKSSTTKDHIYLYRFGDVFAWGTGIGRVRKTSLFNNRFTGKYNRRIIYLMLEKLYGLSESYLFEFDSKATIVEKEIKDNFSQNFCIKGFKGNNLQEISQNIFNEFKENNLSNDLFDDYFNNVHQNNMKHISSNGNKLSFAHGDSSEPTFLCKYRPDLTHLIPGIEKAFNINIICQA